jgi:cytoskeletal protein CcmA (bactofilin family)
MFGKGKRKAVRVDTLIGQQTEVHGEVRFTGGLHVDGAVKGDVCAEPDADSLLTVSELGSVEGDVRVANVILNGTVVGDVHAAGRVELASRARVDGDVYYGTIEIALGAAVNGQLVRRAEAESAALALTQEAGEPRED